MDDWRDLLDRPEEMPEHLAIALDKLLKKRPIDGRLLDLYNEERLMLWLGLAQTRQQVKQQVAVAVAKHVKERYLHKHQHWIL